MDVSVDARSRSSPRPDGWHLTEDAAEFLGRAGDFLGSRPALHTMPLTVAAKARMGADRCVFGHLVSDGAVRAAFYRRPHLRMMLTPLDREQADGLARHLAGLGHDLPGVTADHTTAAAFAEAWQQHTGTEPVRDWRGRLHRLDALTPPDPFPPGRGRVAGARDRRQVIRWCADFAAAVGEQLPGGARGWVDSRFGDKIYTFWETPAGKPVSFAGATSMVAGMVRVDPVYTPPRRRGQGWAAAVTTEVTGAALTAGATDVVLFTDPANTVSNALYRRLGYVPIEDFDGYGFAR